jgi:L-aspartate oxidase
MILRNIDGERIMEKKIYNHLVIGSGIAGLFFAIKVAKSGESILLVTKRSLLDSNSFNAQGGIASVLNDSIDSYQSHIDDTLEAGAGICHLNSVKLCVENGPRLIKELIELGVHFTHNKDGLHLGQEGGHSQRRVAHAGDITGNELIKTLVKVVKGYKNVEILEDFIAVDLITSHCKESKGKYAMGAYLLDKKTNTVSRYLAKNTILATGGTGKVYLYTSNPDVATGDGLAMAYRSGADIANMEFIQFHPTSLYHQDAKSFLISEALRGEGGILKLKTGETFMENYHPMKSLAPRDIVAQAIDAEMKKSGDDCVYLDMTHLSKEFLKDRFPNIYDKALTFGIDMSEIPIPVVPAAHYTCGGVVVDKNGETSIKHLFAIGEVAFTGLHGANRLASNSLLEGLVYGETAAIKALNYADDYQEFERIKHWETGNATSSEEAVLVSQTWDEIRRFMWNYVGIVRSNKRLRRAKARIKMVQQEINQYYWNYFLTPDLVELRNIAIVAELIIESAMSRKESRGFHVMVDYPEKDDYGFKRDTYIRRPII